MNANDPQLVAAITQQVLAALREQSAAPTGRGGNGAAGAKVAGGVHRVQPQPPIGVCTGDYSKFPELTRSVGAPPPRSSPASSSSSAAPTSWSSGEASTPAFAKLSLPNARPSTPALSGFVTANQLQDAIAASSENIAILAADARLTPLAQDFVREHPQQIRRCTEAPRSANPGNPGKAAGAGSWAWWIDGKCPVAEMAMAQRSHLISRITAGASPHTLTAAVRELADGLRRRRTAGAVVFVKTAARAMCYLNRSPHIRAALGLCPDTVQQATSDLGANVLVIEYPQHGAKAVSAMLDGFMQQSPETPAAVRRELEQLE